MTPEQKKRLEQVRKNRAVNVSAGWNDDDDGVDFLLATVDALKEDLRFERLAAHRGSSCGMLAGLLIKTEKERDRLRGVLGLAARTIEAGGDGAITDTIWVGPGMTLLDAILCALVAP